MIDGSERFLRYNLRREGRIAFKIRMSAGSKSGERSHSDMVALARGMTQRFAEFVEFFSYDQLPTAVVTRAKEVILDGIGLAAGGDLAAL